MCAIVSVCWMQMVPDRWQVAGGTEFVRLSMEAFSIPTSQTTLLVDATGFDGFPALAALEDAMLTP